MTKEQQTAVIDVLLTKPTVRGRYREEGVGFCAVGALSDAAGFDWKRDRDGNWPLLYVIIKAFDLTYHDLSRLVGINDSIEDLEERRAKLAQYVESLPVTPTEVVTTIEEPTYFEMETSMELINA